jgi:hypothetical protein
MVPAAIRTAVKVGNAFEKEEIHFIFATADFVPDPAPFDPLGPPLAFRIVLAGMDSTRF